MAETKRCPYCGEEILAIAKKCKYCGEWLNKESASASNNQQQYQVKNEAEGTAAREKQMEIVKGKMLAHPFSFNGRINRKEYVFTILIFYAYLFLAAAITIPIGDNIDEDEAIYLLALMLLPSLYFLFAQGSKRCHDFGLSGWLQLITILIPFFIFILMFIPRKKFANEYGEYKQY